MDFGKGTFEHTNVSDITIIHLTLCTYKHCMELLAMFRVSFSKKGYFGKVVFM